MRNFAVALRYRSIAILMIAFTAILASVSFSEVVVIFDEDEKDEAGNGNFVGVFVSHDAGSTVTVTEKDSISGKVSAFCTPSQSYNNAIGGWSYPIAENEYRYMTFAWKKDGGTGIMIQFAYDNTWAYRYFSGVNVTDWPGIQLEDDIPEDWMVYTRDLVKDFGGGWNLTGIALTPWNGKGGYYDYILIHTEEGEGRIAQIAVEPRGKLATVWARLKQ